MSNKIPILVRIDPIIKERLEKIKETKGIPTTYIINVAIQEWLDRNEKQMLHMSTRRNIRR